jgi:hypothetical protein
LVILALSAGVAQAQVGGTGTPGKVPVWIDPNTIGDSVITQNPDGSLNINTGAGGVNVATNGSPASAIYAVANATSGFATGVSGNSASANGSGLVGINTSLAGGGASGVYGEAMATSDWAAGLNGGAHTPNGVGVQGINWSATGGNGMYGESKATTGYATGVTAVVSSPGGNGVTALNLSDTGGNGVFGEAKATQGYAQGVSGLAHGSLGVGVAGNGPFEGVLGWSADCDATGCHTVAGIGGQFTTAPGGTILSGSVGLTSSDWVRKFRVDSNGKVFAEGGYMTGGADFAESMAVSGERSRYEPGDVVVIEKSGHRQVGLARDAYSTLVAGIYSTKPGVLATPYAMDDPRLLKEIPLAVVGIVPCKVTAANGAIRTGDLLVTSSIPGHAMKGTDRSRMLGAVVGKALEQLASGTGVIQVLVTLQ